MFQQKYYQSSDGLRLAYRDYVGPEDRPPLLCLHGLTRNSADFEDFCAIFADQYRILAADVRGRGLSENDPQPERYQPATYAGDALALLDAEGIETCVLIGTSMGGIIAMVLAAQAPARLIGVVLNDIGPEIDLAGLARISAYVGQPAMFATWEAAADALKAINQPFFPEFNQEDWLRWAKRLMRQEEDGRLVFAYDPKIAEVVRAGGAAPDLWPLFQALHPIPALVVRGATSDILSAQTIGKMQDIKPDLQSVEVPGRGHAPILDEPAAVDAIKAFLQGLR